ncbi:DAK2 domain-containing protein [Clostridiales bacterium FE2011]|nr:DAK2 domain-containing protein [Clostridiales bacterium FE2011]QTE75227.1 DAK2 domain-containing protein [Clostridiales bacterium FE2010]
MIQFKTIDGLLLRDMVMAGTAILEKNREAVDALNVFPVPDGDTGTNMSLTMQSATREINSKEFLRADEAANALAKGALKGARGNSGVITSQLLRGFAKALNGVEKITPVQFAEALMKGSEMAYKAVMKPKEGTILTVARVVAEDAMKQAQKAPDDYDQLISVILKSGEAILKKTPDMLPALKQAGVVDSGGRGLMLIYQGYAAVLRGEDITAADSLMEDDVQAVSDDCHDLTKDLTYTYCVSFKLTCFREDCDEHDLDSFRRRLNRIGDAVSVVGDLNGAEVHVHTDNPGFALDYGVELAEINEIKIDNLAAMKRALEEGVKTEEAAPEETEENSTPEKKYGFVAVSLGNGFSQFFKELNVDQIVEGGQTMNPSVDDLMNAIRQVKAECVYVLPNNGNVIFAANQAAELSPNDVRVIPTKNVAMGIAAAIAFQNDAEPDENMQRMTEAAQHVKTAMVTYAIRDSEYNGIEIKQGDIIGLHNGQIEFSGQSVHDVVLDMMKEIVTDEDELITVYYGADVSEADAKAIAEEIEEQYGDCDVEYHNGGQPLYYYLISVE